MMDDKIILLSATPWDFVDDKGVARQGVSLWVAHLGSVNQGNAKGVKPIKYTVPLYMQEMFETMTLPALCDMECGYDYIRQKPVPKAFTNLEPLV
jgi:hypothetical protein